MANRGGRTERDRFWLEHLRACGEGSLKAYAEAHELDVRALYDAKVRLRRKGVLPAASSPRLVRVEREPPVAGPSYCRVHLPNGVSVEFGCAAGDWPSLFASLAALP